MMQDVEAFQPKCSKAYDSACKMCNYHTRNVMLRVLNCLYLPEEGIPDWKYLSELRNVKTDDILFTRPEKYKLKEIESKESIFKLEHFDVLLLKKLIFCELRSFNDEDHQDAKDNITFILREFVENRNNFAHSDEIFTTISNEAEFERIRERFLVFSKDLLHYSCKITKTPTEEADKFFNNLKEELNKFWPVSQSANLVDMEVDNDFNANPQDIENSTQEKAKQEYVGIDKESNNWAIPSKPSEMTMSTHRNMNKLMNPVERSEMTMSSQYNEKDLMDIMNQ